MKNNMLIQNTECRRLLWPFRRRTAAWLPTLTLCLLGGLVTARGQDPRITNTNNPMDTNVSVGATVSFRVYATSTNPPMTIQWQQAGTNLPGATSATLVIPSVTVAHAGSYVAWITNASGGVTNTRTATLTVDPTFIKITQGVLVTDNMDDHAVAWGDYDGDGDLDVVVAGGYWWSSDPYITTLFTNRGDGIFARAASNPFTGSAYGLCINWGDTDNDGDLDLWLGVNENWVPQYFTNKGNATFTRTLVNPTWIENGVTVRGGMQAWADYDGDGLLDLVVVPAGYDTATTWPLALLHNSGNGRFAAMTNSALYEVKKYSASASWVDLDNDGDLDLICLGGTAMAFRNEGEILTPMPSVELPFLPGARMDAWADFDNDGDLDVLGTVWNGTPQLSRNDGSNGWTLVSGPPYEAFQSVERSTEGNCAAWGDYDNDGDLDLFVVTGGENKNNRNHLFRNDGVGGFVEVLGGSPVNDRARSYQCVWVDYDNDGDLDLHVLNSNDSVTSLNDFLYRNSGNGNHWLEVKLSGRVSNRSAIGAKVRAKAIIGGKEVWQLRTLSAQAWNQELVAHFGLGDATTVDALRIEWPSGIMQEVTVVTANQILSLEEELFLVASSVPEVKPGTVDVPKGGAVTLSVATNPPNATYQWQFNGQNISEATNASLFIPSLSAADLGRYTVLVSTTGLQVFARPVLLGMLGRPVISGLYATTPQTVSVGAPVVLRVSVSGALPLVLQWQHNGVAIPATVNPTALTSELRIEGAALADAGDYRLVASNAVDTVVSAVVSIQVDPTFTKITQGPVVTDREPSQSFTWGDYDNDGRLDLLVLNINTAYTYPNTLYRNLGGDQFVRVTNALTTAFGRSWGAQWADVDNDGDVDLFVNHPFTASNFPNNQAQNQMFRNDGGGVFTRMNNAATAVAGFWTDATWVDINRDGWLDLFATTQSYVAGQSNDDFFWRNLTDGRFLAMTTNEVGVVLKPENKTAGPAWCDIDGDGDLDLYVSNFSGVTNFLYRNDGGRLIPVKAGSLPASRSTWAATWADFNNDGLFDLFTGGENGTNTLHLNRGNWVFEDVTVASGLALAGNVYTASAGDFDNDGDLDLYVPVYDAADVLYVNRGDATFDRANVGSPLTEGFLGGATWVDYNNDGFLDLFQACGDLTPALNLLYRNSLPQHGNTNHWLKLRLKGTVSNASAIGARVWGRAIIGGKDTWQVRQIASACLNAVAEDGLRVHFGLGDATSVTTLRIEWPSGIVQELPNVAANQFLTVVESQSYSPTNPRPSFTGATKDASGLQLSFTEPAAPARYILEASTDLTTWTKLMARTSAGVTTNYTDTRATIYTSRFYRLQVP